MAQCTCSSGKGPGFSSQQLRWGSQSLQLQLLGITPFPDPLGHQGSTWHTYSNASKHEYPQNKNTFKENNG